MSITNRNGGNNGVGKALFLASLPTFLLDPRCGLGVVGFGLIIGTMELLNDQRPEVREWVDRFFSLLDSKGGEGQPKGPSKER